MALQPLEWLGLYLFSFVLGSPYIVEFIRIYLLHTPIFKASSDSKVQSTTGNQSIPGQKAKTWFEHITYSRRWYEFVQTKVWIAPPLWGYPLAWVIVTVTFTASTFLLWSNPQNYSSFGYNFCLSLLFPQTLFELLWIPSFFRMRSHLLAFISSLIVLCSGVASFIVQGVNTIAASFYLFIPFIVWWIWITWLSAEVWRDASRERREDFAFDDVYDPQENINIPHIPQMRGAGKHGWQIVSDPSTQIHRIPPSSSGSNLGHLN